MKNRHRMKEKLKCECYPKKEEGGIMNIADFFYFL